MKNCKIAFVINHVSFFVSHFLPLAIKLQKNGYQVKVFAGKSPSKYLDNYSKKILRNNLIKYEIIGFKVDNLNILNELVDIFHIEKLYLENFGFQT